VCFGFRLGILGMTFHDVTVLHCMTVYKNYSQLLDYKYFAWRKHVKCALCMLTLFVEVYQAAVESW